MKKTMMVLIVVFSLLCTTVFASATTTPSAAVTIISPDSTELEEIGGHNYPVLKTDNLTISVKVTTQNTYQIGVYKHSTTPGDSGEVVPPTPVGDPENFTGTGSLSYYTRSIPQVEAAIYTVEVKPVVNGVVSTSADDIKSKSVIVKDPEEANTTIFSNPSTSPSQFIQNLLKSIFN